MILLHWFRVSAQEGYQVPVGSGNEPIATGKFEPTWNLNL
jgi:hypothetical protein